MVQTKVSHEQNQKLVEPYTEEEVTNAIFQMHPTKAPVPDRYSAMFFQKLWTSVKGDVSKEVLNFLNNGTLDDSLNETKIILLPKTKEAQQVEKFKPISLCNVAMKIIAKVLANRRRTCLPQVISESQSVFH